MAGADATLTPMCGAELRRLTGYTELATAAGTLDLAAATEPANYHLGISGYWVPRYYGPPIVVVTPGIAPPFMRPPLFLPPLLPRALGAGSVHFGGGGFGHGGGHIGGGGGGGSGGGEAALILAVIALSVLPALDIGLAAARVA